MDAQKFTREVMSRFARMVLFTVLCSVAVNLVATLANATTLLIVTDQARARKAREVAALFRVTKPYSLMSGLKIKVIQTSSAKLGCSKAAPSAVDTFATTVQLADSDRLLQQSESRERRSRPHSEFMNALPPSCGGDNGGVPTRLISCETPTTKAFIGALKKSEKASYVEIVLTDSRYGGSGGEYPVITTGSPAAMAIHELMHRLGFADEYGYYNACEADIYCPAGANDDIISPSGYGALPTTAFNIAAFQSLPSYPSSAAVLSSHANLIPWATDIDPQTALTTNGKLGSPRKVATGIYRAIVCDLATVKMETWQSTSSSTIMRTLATTYIPEAYWHVIAKSLGTTISK